MSFLQHQMRATALLTPDQTWDAIQPGISKIYVGDHISTKQYMEMYTNIYYYCTTNNVAMPSLSCRRDGRGFSPGSELMGRVLYRSLSDFIMQHLRRLIDHGRSKFDEPLLQFYKSSWDDFTFSSQVVDNLFLYLNRHWVRREQEDGEDVYEIYSLALVTWREVLLQRLQKTVTDAIIQLIRRERDGDTINTLFVQCIVDSYVNMGVKKESARGRDLSYYKRHLEEPILTETRRYYGIESIEFLHKNPLSEYLKKAVVRLGQEENRVKRYLHESSFESVIRVCEDVLIEHHLPQFYEEFQQFLNNGRDEDMTNMFHLAMRTKEGLDSLSNILNQHIMKQGLDGIETIVNETSNEPRVYVHAIIKVYTKYRQLVMTAFENHPLFVAALDKACERFVNRNVVTERSMQGSKSAELLARYCDFLLKKSSRLSEEQELEDILQQIMIVFRYLDSKDVFQKFYSNMLAKRLVEHLSVSDDAEASMISKLKEACGALYTSKLQKMFQDVAINADLNVRFRKHLKQSSAGLDVDFNVEVLTHGSWPFTQLPTFALPAELETCMERFKLFYSQQHSGRKLVWLYHKSRAELTTNCFRRKYTMISSMYQVSVLVQYNHNTSYTLQQLQENTNIDVADLQQVLRTLLKIRVLMCDVSTADDEAELPATAVFDLYQDYMNKKTRININTALKTTEKREVEATHKNVDDERKYLIEAAVIRIMKTKKKLQHEELVGEVMKQLVSRFKVDNRSIKKCIDNLIDREYLERSPESPKIYQYVA